MDLSRGYGLTDHDRALLDLLVGVASVVRDRVGFPGMALGREHDASVALLVADGLVRDYEEFDGHQVALAPRGLDVVHEVSHRRMDLHERWTAVRGALLDWLWDRYLRGEPEPLSWEESFRTTRWGMFLGE